MIRAFHAVFTTYGFWLPNDPRGSWSDFVRSLELLHFGKATTVSTRKSLARQRHPYDRRQAAKQVLKYPCVHFTGRQARSVARGFRVAIEESGYVLHACSILPEHVHLVVARHARRIEQIIGHFKARASQSLAADEQHPLAGHRRPDGSYPSPWARYGWTVYLNAEDHIREAIAYVERNPTKEGKPPQNWSFVTPCEI
jgi:REP element-mobilizing transposase RayT